MAANNSYSRLVGAMRREGAYHNEGAAETGTVTAVNPVTVRYKGTTTGKIVNTIPAVDADIHAALESSELSVPLKEYLKAVYDKFNLQPGDRVVVQKTGNTLYILGKV